MSPEMVKQAAIQLKGEVFTGQTHAFAYEKAVETMGKRFAEEAITTGWEQAQGFVTSTGRFVSRAEATEIAKAAKQLPAGKRTPKGLTVEDF